MNVAGLVVMGVIVRVLVRMNLIAETLRRSNARLLGFDLPVARRRVAHQRLKQMLGGVGDLVDGAIVCFFIRLGRFCEAAELADELER
ncbi:MAG: hypothetical protein QOG27_1416 [Verrucomicrobiota bacterium]